MSSPFSWHSEGMEPVNGAGFLRRITRLSVCRGDVPLPPRHALASARPVSAAARLRVSATGVRAGGSTLVPGRVLVPESSQRARPGQNGSP